MIIEARDSVTGALLGRVLDRRETQQSGTMMMTNSVTNLSDFRTLCRTWASISAKGLTTFRKVEKGKWEKVAGPGVDMIVGSEQDIAAVEAEKSAPKKIDLDAAD